MEKNLLQKTQNQNTDLIFRAVTAACATLVLVIIAGIFVELVRNSSAAFQAFGADFITSDKWDHSTQEFGALPAIYGTFLTTAIAVLIAAPLAIAIAIFLVELAPPKVATVIGGAIELLAAVPSIIYGMWGMFVFAPFIEKGLQPFLGENFGFLPIFQGNPNPYSILTAGIILAIMILPFIAAITRDVLKMVPDVLKESAYGVGSTTWEVTKKVSLRYGISGIIGALFLGLGRAIGETMAVTFVIGNNSAITGSLFSSGQSIASTLANEFNEATDPVHFSSLMTLGLILFVITIIFQAVAQLWTSGLRKQMGRQ